MCQGKVRNMRMSRSAKIAPSRSHVTSRKEVVQIGKDVIKTGTQMKSNTWIKTVIIGGCRESSCECQQYVADSLPALRYSMVTLKMSFEMETGLDAIDPLGDLTISDGVSTITIKKNRCRSQPPSQHTRQSSTRSPNDTGSQSRRNFV